jgi:DNA polymerase-3 subunit alpha
MIRGNISQRDDGNSLRANSIETIEGGADFIRGPVVLRVPEAEATREILEELDRILQVHTGSEEVQVKLVGEVGERLFKLQPRVKITSELYGELKVLLGSKCLT